MLDPHLKDGVHEWRDGKRLIKEGVKVYIEGTNTLAGRCVFISGSLSRRISNAVFFQILLKTCERLNNSVVTLDVCVRNFTKFTGCTLGEAIKCATYNPAAYVDLHFFFILALYLWHPGVSTSKAVRAHYGRVPMQTS